MGGHRNCALVRSVSGGAAPAVEARIGMAGIVQPVIFGSQLLRQPRDIVFVADHQIGFQIGCKSIFLGVRFRRFDGIGFN